MTDDRRQARPQTLTTETSSDDELREASRDPRAVTLLRVLRPHDVPLTKVYRRGRDGWTAQGYANARWFSARVLRPDGLRELMEGLWLAARDPQVAAVRGALTDTADPRDMLRRKLHSLGGVRLKDKETGEDRQDAPLACSFFFNRSKRQRSTAVRIASLVYFDGLSPSKNAMSGRSVTLSAPRSMHRTSLSLLSSLAKMNG